jgi:hypothetical protein
VSCSVDAINAPSIDPLMLLVFAKSMAHQVVSSPLLIASMAFSGAALLAALPLCLPVVFNWKHARNVHATCIFMAGSATFLLFVTALCTTAAVSAAISAIATVTLQVVEVERGTLLEALLWTAVGIWCAAFLFAWFVRWWEILERREQKRRVHRELRELRDQNRLAAQRLNVVQPPPQIVVDVGGQQMRTVTM